VVRIDATAQHVQTADNTVIAYDRLLIATGSRPIMPEGAAGMDAEGVATLRTLADARQMADRARHSQSAVVLGAGLQGMKAAMALLHRGLAVSLVEKEEEILPWLMDPDAGGWIRRALEDAGVAVITGSTIKEIKTDAQGVCGVVLDNGRELACQLVCIGIGVTPNTACLESTGIRVDAGVVTDAHTACSAPNVFAAGDVTMTIDAITRKPIVTGQWTHAVEMGRCAGANMAGRPIAYGGTFGTMNAIQVAGRPLVSMGIVHTAGTDYEVFVKASPNAYHKLVFSSKGERLVGALFIGDITNAGLYRLVMRERMDVNGIKPQLIGHQLHYGHLLFRRKPKDFRSCVAKDNA
jgi:NAD(P)H-nitrite reductase large subunit